MRQKEILQLFKNVDSSNLSAEKYFITHETPVSLSQYYRLKKRFYQQGITGLEDNRTAGNARKQSPQQTKFLSSPARGNALATRQRRVTHKNWTLACPE